MKKWIALLLAGVLMLSCLAGCGGKETPAPAPGGETPAPAPGGSSTPTPAPEVEGPHVGPDGRVAREDQTYRSTYSSELTTLNYLSTGTTYNLTVGANCIDPLVENDQYGNIVPCGATEWSIEDEEYVNYDGETVMGQKWTFKIREGQVWVDNQGREVGKVTADNWVAGMQHVCDAAGGLEYLLGAGFANIVNADAYVAGEVTDFAQVGVKAIDDYTVEYTLTQPTSYFPTMLGYGVFAPMSRSYYESMGGKFGADFDNTAETCLYGKGPDSIAYCGPYVITSFTSNNTIVCEANKSYWNKDGMTIEEAICEGSDIVRVGRAMFIK